MEFDGKITGALTGDAANIRGEETADLAKRLYLEGAGEPSM
jgi:hypothetical protein